MAINKSISTINVDSAADDGKVVVYNSSGRVFEAYVIPNVGVRVYKAIIEQASTDAPTATVLQNTLDSEDPVVWTRTSAGIYVATLAGAFPVGQVLIHFTGEGGGGSSVNYYITHTSANAITLTVTDVDDAVTDLLSTNGSYITIEVYPA